MNEKTEPVGELLFSAAEVIAVDAAATMLDRVRAKALDLGLQDAIRTAHADLDDSWPALGPARPGGDHIADPDRGFVPDLEMPTGLRRLTVSRAVSWTRQAATELSAFQ